MDKRALLIALLFAIIQAGAAVDVEAMCKDHPTENGFFCLEGMPNSYLQCHLPEMVSVIRQCPAGTVCLEKPNVFFLTNPCGIQVSQPPQCGNGKVEAGEECEVGGLGCSAQCKCMPNFKPDTPAAKDCLPAVTQPVCGNGKVEAGEECEVGGIGCSDQCKCLANFKPDTPAGKNCLPVITQPINLTAICEKVDEGFFCLPGVSNQFLRCHPLELVAELMPCPAGTVCTAEPLVLTLNPPCGFAQAPAPQCGNGKVEAGEECEVGGVGCSAQCKCLANFKPATPAVKDCVPVILQPVCGNGKVEAGEECEVGGIGCSDQCKCLANFKPDTPAGKNCLPVITQPTNLTAICEKVSEGFFCLPGVSDEFLRCHPLELVAEMMPCPAGTVCVAEPLVLTLYPPCDFPPKKPTPM